MKIKNGNTFENAYKCYLEWFQDRAVAQAKPKSMKDFLGYQIGAEDVFEKENMLLARTFFFVPIFPSESKFGRMEIFTISELNFMEKVLSKNGEDDILDVEAIEYETHFN